MLYNAQAYTAHISVCAAWPPVMVVTDGTVPYQPTCQETSERSAQWLPSCSGLLVNDKSAISMAFASDWMLGTHAPDRCNSAGLACQGADHTLSTSIPEVAAQFLWETQIHCSPFFLALVSGSGVSEPYLLLVTL